MQANGHCGIHHHVAAVRADELNHRNVQVMNLVSLAVKYRCADNFAGAPILRAAGGARRMRAFRF
jgi:hypothetical protein